ncbi:hypothetical protein BgiBS90_017780, partial [Biomphalaria glabrata]
KGFETAGKQTDSVANRREKSSSQKEHFQYFTSDKSFINLIHFGNEVVSRFVYKTAL